MKRCHDRRGSTYVAINAKRGNFLLVVVIDVNPSSTRGYPYISWLFSPTKLLYSGSRMLLVVSTCQDVFVEIWKTT